MWRPHPPRRSRCPKTPLATAPANPAAPPVAAAPSDRPVPLPGQSPPPSYPPAALRRGESGTVVVRVDVDASGMPLDARIIQRSGSRDLDRAALEAVRGWRFQPAQSNGQPMAGSLEIPIDFQPAQ
ncbi:MAG: energy transducer TonB [Stenotrophomonas sp.]